LAQHGSHFLAGQRHREALPFHGTLDIAQPWQFDLQHITVKEEERVESLALGGCRNVSLAGNV